MALYLVTGGAGFIGSHLATALAARGDRVRLFDDLSTGSLENVAHLDVGPIGGGTAVEFLEGSITDPASARDACQGVTGVLHEAAQVSVPQSVQDPDRSYEINVMGTLRMLEAARAAGVERFLFAASSAAYGDAPELPKLETMAPQPLSPYASGKVAGEHLLEVWGRVHDLRTVSLRYFNIFGPRQADDSPYTGVIAIFAKAVIEGRRPKVFGDGSQTRDFTYVDNVVDANLRALGRDLPAGCVLNVGTGIRVSINDLFDEMARYLRSDLRPEYAETRTGDVLHSVASYERARELLGYEPKVSWRHGLAVTLDWYRARLGASSVS